MKAPDRHRMENQFSGVFAQIEGCIGSAKRVGAEAVTDIVLGVKTERDTIKASRHFTPTEGDD